MKLSEQVEALEHQVADLKEQVSTEREHKHLMIDRMDSWRGACAAKELELKQSLWGSKICAVGWGGWSVNTHEQRWPGASVI